MNDFLLLFLPLSLIPPAIDDLIDYYVDDFTWIPSIPIIIYAIFYNPWTIFLSLIVFSTIALPLYIYSNRVGEVFGEGDLILYLIYCFYAGVMGNLLHYIFLLIFTNMYGLIFYVLRFSILGVKENVIPLIFMSPFAVFTTLLIVIG